MDTIELIVHEVLAELWEVFPYFLFGVLIEAWVRTKKWHVHIRKTLLYYGYTSIILATLVGLMSPLCACGILPLTISLILGGLPLAPAVSLLVASPLMSPAGYTLAVKNVGPLMANAELAAAVFMGLYAGTVVHLLERRGMSVKSLFRKELPPGDFHDQDYPEEVLRCHCDDMLSKKVEHAGKGPWLIFLAKVWEGGVKVGKFLVLGILIMVLANLYLPKEWIESLLTTTNPLALAGFSLGLIPLHITQITATALLFGFKDIPPTPAASMTLLIGGPVTSIPVLYLFLTMFRPRLFFLYLALCLSGTLMVALTAQYFLG